MPLFLVQDSDRPAYVVAENWGAAILKWKAAVGPENDLPPEEMDEPRGVQLVAENNDLIVDDDFVDKTICDDTVVAKGGSVAEITVPTDQSVIQYAVPSLEETKARHSAAWEKLDGPLRNAAVNRLKREIPEPIKEMFRNAIEADPLGWWVAHHFGLGMSIRNSLRKGGIDDSLVPSGDLEDYWVPAVEAALDIHP